MPKFYKAVLFFLFAFCSTNTAQSKQYYFNRLTTDDGLCHNEVMAIRQSRDGFMWFATYDGLSRFDGKKFKTYRLDRTGLSSFGINSFWTVCEDAGGNLWVGSNGLSRYNPATDSLEYCEIETEGGLEQNKRIKIISACNNGSIFFLKQNVGLYRYQPKDGSLRFFALPVVSPDNHRSVPVMITTFSLDPDGILYTGTESGDVFVLDTITGRYAPLPSNGLRLRDDPVQKITVADGSLYIGYQYSGVMRYDLQKEVYHKIPAQGRDGYNWSCVLDMMYKDDCLWVATEKGLHIHNRPGGVTEHLSRDFFDPYSLSDNALYSLAADREGGIWIGTYFHGVNFLPPDKYTFFDKYYPRVSGNSISGKAVREICQGADGDIWIGTEDGGLNRFDPVAKTFRKYNDLNIHGLAVLDDKLYIGIYFQGLSVMDLKTGSISEYKIFNEKHNIQFNSIYSICPDTKKQIWIGTKRGVYLFDPLRRQFEKNEALGDVFAHNISLDSKGNVWIATFGDGVFRCDTLGRLTSYSETITRQLGVSVAMAHSIYEDSRGHMWLSTFGSGIVRFDPKSGFYKQYSEREGVPSTFVYKPVDDGRGRLWFGTNNGLVCLDQKTDSIRIYTSRDGLPTNQFNFNSSFRDSAGTLYFGTTSGLVTVDPAASPLSDDFPEIRFTGFQIFNREVPVGNRSPLKRSILLTDYIELPYNLNTVGIDIAVLRFFTPKGNTCYVKLEGFDRDWTLLEDNLKVVRANLPPGRYTLKVRVADKEGHWKESEKTLSVRIRPPFWATQLAYLTYILLFLGMGYGVYRLIRRRMMRRRVLWEEDMARQKERESYQAKIDFFIDIAHEIKTPLSLVKIPLEELLKRGNKEAQTVALLETMDRNLDRLLNLTCQILDFQKIESKVFSLTFSKVCINQLLESIYQRFSPIAEQRGIAMTLFLPSYDVFAYVDEENLTKIISNLFSNALKFCHKRIEIWLKPDTRQGRFEIIVDNDGELVPEPMREQIFEAFVQVPRKEKSNTGQGLGLALARSLAQLHGGTIALDTAAGTNKFILSLPFNNKEAGGDVGVKERELPIDRILIKPDDASSMENLLIVEDDAEMLDFIAQSLSEIYGIYRATNGREALKMLSNAEINLIITDIMMPRMDGIELLKTVKSNLNSSHIPVILLTARAGLQSKIEGLEMGADAYIEKPFSLDYLKVQVSNLLANRKKMKEQFSNQPFTLPQSMAISKADEQFLQKLNRIIEENIQNPQLGVDLLADQLHMSRSSLHRKLKGVAGLTPNDYIRVIKLKKAAALLREGNLRISEVSEAAGFTNPSYFSKCFQEHFGVLPKDFCAKAP